MDENTKCRCGHAFKEHGHDPEFSQLMACDVEGCDCDGFCEPDEVYEHA